MLHVIRNKANPVVLVVVSIEEIYLLGYSYSSITALNTRFGGLPVRVAMPPVFAAYAMDSANALESLLCILRASGVALLLDGELSIENWA